MPSKNDCAACARCEEIHAKKAIHQVATVVGFAHQEVVGGVSTATRARPPTPPTPRPRRLLLVRALFRVEIQPVADHAAPVVLEPNPPFALWDEAVRHHVAHHPAADALARCVDSRVLEPPSLVAGPVVCCLRGGRVFGSLGASGVVGCGWREVVKGDSSLRLHQGGI